jgi:alcohol dehydrogenase
MNITKFAIPEIIFGRGSLNYAGQCALRLGARKVFLVRRRIGKAAGAATMDILERISNTLLSRASPNPRDYQVDGRRDVPKNRAT